LIVFLNSGGRKSNSSCVPSAFLVLRVESLDNAMSSLADLFPLPLRGFLAVPGQGSCRRCDCWGGEKGIFLRSGDLIATGGVGIRRKRGEETEMGKRFFFKFPGNKFGVYLPNFGRFSLFLPGHPSPGFA
jgi:hypothetical protein